MTDLQLLAASGLSYTISSDGVFTIPTIDPLNPGGDILTPGSTFWYYNTLQGAQEHKVIKKGAATCLMFRKKESIIIAFRGTINPTNCEGYIDWLNNMNATLVLWNGYKVHSGFAEEVDLMYSDILKTLKNWNKDNKHSIYLTGHSQGGGEAILAGFKLDMDEISINRIVTFAAPNVGDKNFSKTYNNKLLDTTLRYQYAGDIVPLLPPDMGSFEKPTTIPQILQQDNKLKSNDFCNEFASKIIEIITAIWTGQGDIKEFGKDLLSYYAVGTLKFIDFDNKLKPNISYSDILNDMLFVLIDPNNQYKHFTYYHSLNDAYLNYEEFHPENIN